MAANNYIMESEGESHRLDVKVDRETIKRQALWAGLEPGMRVADFGCGPGMITAIFHELVQPGGSVVGVDSSAGRLEYARKKYGREGVEFIQEDLTGSLTGAGTFDFIWVRFVLEYHLERSQEMVRNFSRCLNPGGIMCLVDLDHNPFNYFGASERLERTMGRILKKLESHFSFDPHVGRKLYSFLYDLRLENIDVQVENYRVSYGEPDPLELFNMMKKIELVPGKIDFTFDEYPGGYDEFRQEAEAFLSDPRRFAYTPLILARGVKPPA